MSNETSAIGSRFGMRRFRPWEVTGMRILFAWMIYRVLPLAPPGKGPWFGTDDLFGPAGQLAFDTQGSPRGLANFMDVTFMADPNWQIPLWIICVLALISYGIGRGLIVSVPVLCLITAMAGALENSQGYVFHGHKLVSLILLTQTVVLIVHQVDQWIGRRKASKTESRYSLSDYLIRFTQAAIIAAYVVAGMSKIIESQGRWVQDSQYSGVYLVKTYRQNYYKRLDAEAFGQERVPYAQEMLENPNLTRLFMAAGLILELLCFVALWNRFAAFVIGLSIVIFHRLVDEIMNLQFPENEVICVIFLANPVFWLGAGILWIWGRARSPAASA